MRRHCIVVTLACVVSWLLAPGTGAQPRPAMLDRVAVDERLGERIPLDLWFSDAGGRRVQLRELFADGKPVLLALAYVRCKMLCSLVLRGLTRAIDTAPLALGREYRVITISIDPHEDAASAAARRRELLGQLTRPLDPSGWTYLVGAERPIRALADSLGFRYAWDPRTEQYAHPAVIFVLSPDGTIARYLHGIEYPSEVLAPALRRAATGEAQPASIAETVLSCFRFDPAARAHREQIETYLKIGGAAVMLSLMSTLVWLFAWERRRRRST